MSSLDIAQLVAVAQAQMNSTPESVSNLEILHQEVWEVTGGIASISSTDVLNAENPVLLDATTADW